MKIFRISFVFTAAVAFLACGQPRLAQAATVGINPPTDGATVSTTTLNVTTTFSQPTVQTPGQVNWSIIITNTGSVLASTVSVSNELPTMFQYVETDVAATLANLGDIAPGESIVKTFGVIVPATTAASRYVDEATVSAANVESQESDAAIDVISGQVLGAEDTNLAVTGVSPLPVFVAGLVIVLIGLLAWRLKTD